jgi:Na+/proline symporter/CheY-like chemotaxis protein
MLSDGTIILAGLVWAGLLFGVALIGERRDDSTRPWWGIVYALSLAVHCTSWTFYGTVTQAAQNGWPVTPTFIGTILLFTFAYPFLLRLAELARAQNSTSIADLIASRFGKSSELAAVITLVAVIGMVPYIALQLKAVAMSFSMLTAAGRENAAPAWQDIALWIAVLMALFSMLFGTRRAAATEHNRGLVMAMGFESLFKLTAMLAVGGFAIWGMNGGVLELAAAARTSAPPAGGSGFLALALLGALAIFTLPHQFHIGFVELNRTRHLGTARWLFPLYLLLIAAPVLPLAWAGQIAFGALVPSDLYVLALPLSRGEHGLALFTFLGGLSAATGMVIMTTITLSIMIGNHWASPWLLRGAMRDRAARSDLRGLVLIQRRLGIALVLLLAYGYSRALGAYEVLSDIGALSLSALAQLAPAMVAAVYFPALPRRAIEAGLAAGFLLWGWLLLLPQLADAGLIEADTLALFGWFAPQHFLGTGNWDALTRGVLLSLAGNVFACLVFARRGWAPVEAGVRPMPRDALRALAERFLSPLALERTLAIDAAGGTLASRGEIERVEHELAAVVGAASARLLVDAARGGAGGTFETVAAIVDEASEASRFNHALLEAALQNMSQGISVVDRDLRLVAWNRTYAELFDYPPELLEVGTSVERLVRHNAERGMLGAGAVDELVALRLAHMHAGTPYIAERSFPDGRVVEIRGNPMPHGGFVATFTDVTAFRRAEHELQQVNETLEQRVGERTAESEHARQEAERANRAKSRFLAAVTHDLVQPIHAAHLFTHALAQRLAHPEYREAVANIDGALASTEALLASLTDISRLDAGGLAPRIAPFPLRDLLASLASEFGVLARERGVDLRWRSSSVWVASDAALLRRVLQNFLSNAVRYSERGRVLLGVRRRGAELVLEVWDTGPGIAEADRRLIFEEFRRLDQARGAPGLGLGLAIADRIARLLGHRIELRSWPGRGSVFGLLLPRAVPGLVRPAAAPGHAVAPRLRVLVVDNDPTVLEAMRSLLTSWQCEVDVARDASAARALAATAPPDLLLLDYHLDDALTGVALRRELGLELPAIVITADHSDAVRLEVETAGCQLLHKPLRPLALKSLMARASAARTRAA